MESTYCLPESDREFFQMVDQAATINPFSEERLEIDLKIAGGRYDTVEAVIEKTIMAVQNRISALEAKGNTRLSDFDPQDRPLMEHVYLFQFFYLFRDKFDQLIVDQIESPATSIKVMFAPDVYTFLVNKGFDPQHIHRYMAVCYQLRRAFFFINRFLIGSSQSMKTMRYKLWNNVFTHNIDLYDRFLWNRMEDFSTIILGETGTGKGTAAMAIGRSGYIPFDEKRQCFAESFLQSFISLNLSQFPESLIESELFGHKKGAFTGAVENYKGVFSCCSPYGSIFLDEIGEVSIPVQIKLLAVLHDREFCPVGSHQSERFHGRVIAATNRSLDRLRKNGTFRDDFYYRLCSDIITVPPLRLRIAQDPVELSNLLAFTVERLVGKPSEELTEMIKDRIVTQLGWEYPWPGNVRELEQCVRRIILGQSYEGDDKYTHTDPDARLIAGINSGNMNAQDVLSGYCHMLYNRCKNFEQVARTVGLDSRTVKKYIRIWEEAGNEFL